MHIRLGIKERCIGRIYDKQILQKAIADREAYKFLYDSSLCLEKNIDNYKAAENIFDRRPNINPKSIPYNISTNKVGYRKEDFYAFRMNGNEFINITQQVLKEYSLE